MGNKTFKQVRDSVHQKLRAAQDERAGLDRKKSAMDQAVRALGTVWCAGAKIQRIGADNRWETLAECSDTPNAIKAAAAELVEKGYEPGKLWVNGQATGLKMISDL